MNMIYTNIKPVSTDFSKRICLENNYQHKFVVPCLSNSVETQSVCIVIIRSLHKQEAQLMLTNPHDTLRGQSRSPNIVPFHMLGIFPLVQ